ncbi:MAG: hypothetical protein ACRETA_08040 [Gammaproteobacteria bacterium]
MIRLFGILTALLAMGVAGCTSLSCGDSHPYLDSSTRPPLKAPAGLSLPTPDPNYAIQGASPNVNKHVDRDASGVCLIKPPLLINNQAVTKPKSPTTASKGPSELPPALHTQPASKPAGVPPKPAPAASTAAPVPPPAVAASGHMGYSPAPFEKLITRR